MSHRDRRDSHRDKDRDRDRDREHRDRADRRDRERRSKSAPRGREHRSRSLRRDEVRKEERREDIGTEDAEDDEAGIFKKKSRWDNDPDPNLPVGIPVPLGLAPSTPGSITKTITIPAIQQGGLIGKGGEQIMRIRRDSKADIRLQVVDTETAIVFIRGMPEAVELAEVLVHSRLQEVEAGGVGVQWAVKLIDVAKPLIGEVIGHKGAHLQEMSAKSFCKIKFVSMREFDDTSDEGQQVCCIRGPPEKVDFAEKLVLEKVSHVQDFHLQKRLATAHRPPPVDGEPHDFKRVLCKFFDAGNCTKGDKCTFAHGLDDLRPRNQKAPQIVSPPDSSSLGSEASNIFASPFSIPHHEAPPPPPEGGQLALTNGSSDWPEFSGKDWGTTSNSWDDVWKGAPKGWSDDWGDWSGFCKKGMKGNVCDKGKFGGKDFGGKEFSGHDFGGKDFSGKDFGGKGFGGKDLAGKDFAGKDFMSKEFTGKDFGGKDFVCKDVGKDVGGKDFAGKDFGSKSGKDGKPGEKTFKGKGCWWNGSEGDWSQKGKGPDSHSRDGNLMWDATSTAAVSDAMPARSADPGVPVVPAAPFTADNAGAPFAGSGAPAVTAGLGIAAGDISEAAAMLLASDQPATAEECTKLKSLADEIEAEVAKELALIQGLQAAQTAEAAKASLEGMGATSFALSPEMANLEAPVAKAGAAAAAAAAAAVMEMDATELPTLVASETLKATAEMRMQLAKLRINNAAQAAKQAKQRILDAAAATKKRPS